MTPSTVQLKAASEANLVNGNAAGSSTDVDLQDVVERGVIAHWEGFESVSYDILYRQVPCCQQAGTVPALVYVWRNEVSTQLCSSVGSKATKAAF